MHIPVFHCSKKVSKALLHLPEQRSSSSTQHPGKNTTVPGLGPCVVGTSLGLTPSCSEAMSPSFMSSSNLRCSWQSAVLCHPLGTWSIRKHLIWRSGRLSSSAAPASRHPFPSRGYTCAQHSLVKGPSELVFILAHRRVYFLFFWLFQQFF